MQKTLLATVSFFGGIFAAFVSLLFSIALYHPAIYASMYVGVAVPVFIEEIVKFFSITFLYKSSSLWEKSNNLLISGLFLGFGFGFFEVLLIFLKEGQFFPASLFMVLVHMLSSLMIGIGIAFHRNKNLSRGYPFLFLLLAIIIHLCYNLIVIKLMGNTPIGQ